MARAEDETQKDADNTGAPWGALEKVAP